MKVIGLDLSINSTGVCVKDDNQCRFYIIVPKLTKKQQTHKIPDLKYIVYEKFEQGDDYASKEYFKTISMINLATVIKSIIDYESALKPISKAMIEGISYGSGSGRVADLAGLNYLVRDILIKNSISFKIISPMTNKKFAVGNGGCEKDVIVASFQRLHPEFKGTSLKIDDIADAYFLASNSD